MQYAPSYSDLDEARSSRDVLDDRVRRDLRLALEQKKQADWLVETLTKRCDSLRLAVSTERKDAEERIQSLEMRIKKDQTEKQTLYDKLGEAHRLIDNLQKQLLVERNRSVEFGKIAEAAVEEAAATMRDMTLERVKNRG